MTAAEQLRSLLDEPQCSTLAPIDHEIMVASALTVVVADATECAEACQERDDAKEAETTALDTVEDREREIRDYKVQIARLKETDAEGDRLLDLREQEIARLTAMLSTLRAADSMSLEEMSELTQLRAVHSDLTGTIDEQRTRIAVLTCETERQAEDLLDVQSALADERRRSRSEEAGMYEERMSAIRALAKPVSPGARPLAQMVKLLRHRLGLIGALTLDA